MTRTARRTRAARILVAAAATIAIASTAGAQRAHPVVGRAADAPPPPPTVPFTPYPGATITVDPRPYAGPAYGAPGYPSLRHYDRGGSYAMPGYYYSPAYAYYPSVGYGGGVYDTSGRPLASYFDPPPPAQYESPMGVPDLTGSPYTVIRGGAMVVDFGNGDRRTVPACATVAAEATPDGRPRTIFYTPQPGALVLRQGSQGRVHGAPGAGARACYEADAYGRVVLSY
jgi:hypothetical protein